MPSDPQPDSAERSRIPFEPAKSRKKSAREKPGPKPAQTEVKRSEPKQSERVAVVTTKTDSIPPLVSRRMARRMGLFCGIPTSLGLSIFCVSYWVVSHGIYKLPTVAVVLSSLGCFGLGVLGLSYGVLSASWDEEVPGSKLGWSEFTLNFGRMTAAWRAAKQKNS